MAVSESGCESDWIPYSDKKCLRILKTKGTEAEAKANCSLLDSTSTLVNIGSKSEQEYLNEQLKSYRSIADSVWIGLKHLRSWSSRVQEPYQNWDEFNMKDGKSCLQMSLTDNNLGDWTFDNCDKEYLIVCQKKPTSINALKEDIKSMKIMIDKKQKEILEIMNENDNQFRKILTLEGIYYISQKLFAKTIDL